VYLVYINFVLLKIKMMESCIDKTIYLTGLKPENYRLQAAQCESTFSVHGVLNIVLGRELHPDESVQTPCESEAGDAEICSCHHCSAAQVYYKVRKLS
jgi:hypothetical protein